jgi:hypothetical protein
MARIQSLPGGLLKLFVQIWSAVLDSDSTWDERSARAAALSCQKSTRVNEDTVIFQTAAELALALKSWYQLIVPRRSRAGACPFPGCTCAAAIPQTPGVAWVRDDVT